jgi:hypothetical protein
MTGGVSAAGAAASGAVGAFFLKKLNMDILGARRFY